MAHTSLTLLYNKLLPFLSPLNSQQQDYLAALNVCLVAGNLRPATLVEPHLAPLNINGLITLCQTHGLQTKLWGNTKNGPNLLVYQPSFKTLVDQVVKNSSNTVLMGRLLGYRCEGDISNKQDSYHFIEFIVPNPRSGNENAFIGYICIDINSTLVRLLKEDGSLYNDFFLDNDLANKVKLKVTSNLGNVLVNEWL